jgi:transposase-like protein
MENDIAVTAGRRRSPAERRELVAKGVKAGKSNRAIARELGVTEGTIRGDRKFLAASENESPIEVTPPKPEKILPVHKRDSPKPRRQRPKTMSEILQDWIGQQDLILTEVEDVLHEAGKLLYQYRDAVNRIPEPSRSPAELLSLTQPNQAVEDYMPAKLNYCAEWLARWLACCLPRKEEQQEEVLRQASIWARHDNGPFVY